MSAAPNRWVPLESNPEVRELVALTMRLLLEWKFNYLSDQVLNQVRETPQYRCVTVH